MKETKRDLGILCGIDVCAVCAAMAVYLAIRHNLIGDCLIYRCLHLYCPACGGTRALTALCRGQVWTAVKFNPFAVFVPLYLIYYNTVSVYKIIKYRPYPLLPHPAAAVIAVVLLVGYGIFRDVLLVTVGFDPIGDLAKYWIV